MVRWLLASLFWILFCARAWGAACPAPTDTGDLRMALESAEVAFAGMKKQPVLEHAARARRVLPCVEDEVGRELAARFHRVQGLARFLERKPDAAKACFAAARSLEPAWQLPRSMVPEGHPVERMYDAIPIEDPATKTVPPPAAGRLQFDGRQTLERPLAWPTVLQIFDAEGAVTTTALLLPADPMPAYEQRIPEDPGAVAAARRQRVYRWGAVGSLAASVLCYGAAAWTHHEFQQAESRSQAVGLYNWNHGLLLTSGGTAALGLTLGAISSSTLTVHW